MPYEALVPWYRAQYIPKLLATLDIKTPLAFHEVVFEDQTGIITTLRKAMQLLESGQVTRCLVGGVDSLLEPRWLDACNDLRILKTATHPVGFMPGEAAAFLLLEQEGRARREGRAALGIVEGVNYHQGTAHRFSAPPPDGRPLSEVIRASLRQVRHPCSTFYCDLNGDAVRSHDWGMAMMHLQPEHSRTSLVVPAESFGETRAAYGYMASCMALHTFAREPAPTDPILVWAASDSGARGSFILTRQPSRGVA
jgi:3-oxoacyl-[acyl-carrier-protein] synthase-1